MLGWQHPTKMVFWMLSIVTVLTGEVTLRWLAEFNHFARIKQLNVRESLMALYSVKLLSLFHSAAVN